MNFVIFRQGRTGSNLLVNLLQAHPQIQCEGEILGQQRLYLGRNRYLRALARALSQRFPAHYLTWMASRRTRPIFGFKLLFAHARAPHKLLADLHRREWLIIHLQRRHLFDLAISKSVALATRHFGESSLPDYPGDIVIEISMERFIELLQGAITIRRRELDTLRHLPHFSVTYESDLLTEVDRNRIGNAVFAALHADLCHVATHWQRSWTRPYTEVVVNHAELREFMQTARGAALQAEWDSLFPQTSASENWAGEP